MAKQYTSRQIAAHFSQDYLEQEKDPEVLQDFINTLEKRVPQLRRSPDRECYLDVSSLLYCVRDLKSSCRDAGMSAGQGKRMESMRNLERASGRLQEIGELLTDIRRDHPEEYEESCKEFVTKWREMDFDKGEKILGVRPVKEPEYAPAKTPAPKPSGPVL